jgi:hypothetical protein
MGLQSSALGRASARPIATLDDRSTIQVARPVAARYRERPPASEGRGVLVRSLPKLGDEQVEVH